jgi:hypothetical protein
MMSLDVLWVQVASFASLILLYLGHQYITVGYGLHPIIAGSAATLLVILPHLLSFGEEGLW